MCGRFGFRGWYTTTGAIKFIEAAVSKRGSLGLGAYHLLISLAGCYLILYDGWDDSHYCVVDFFFIIFSLYEDFLHPKVGWNRGSSWMFFVLF